MPQTVQFEGVTHTFPDDFTQADISKALASYHGPAPADSLPPAGPSPSLTRSSMFAAKVGPLLGWLPTAGGAVGGLAGGALDLPGGAVPGAVAGAAVGGAAGEAAREGVMKLFGGGPALSPKNVAVEGGKQAGYELAGAGAGRLAGATLGKLLMRGAIRPTPTMLAKFPTVVEDAMKAGVPVGKLPLLGSGNEIARAKLGQSGKALKGLLGASSATHDAGDIAQAAAGRVLDEISNQPLQQADRAALAGMADEFTANFPDPLGATQLKRIKVEAWKGGKALLAKVARGELPGGEAIRARYNEAIGQEIQDRLAQIPGVAAREAQTQKLIGVRGATRRAATLRTGTELPVGAGAMDMLFSHDPSQAIMTALAARALMTPAVSSRLALAAGPAFGQAPRLAGGALFPRLFTPDTLQH